MLYGETYLNYCVITFYPTKSNNIEISSITITTFIMMYVCFVLGFIKGGYTSINNIKIKLSNPLHSFFHLYFILNQFISSSLYLNFWYSFFPLYFIHSLFIQTVILHLILTKSFPHFYFLFSCKRAISLLISIFFYRCFSLFLHISIATAHLYFSLPFSTGIIS